MKLYKYMHEDRVKNILVDNKIRFTQPKYFNDPFDGNPAIRDDELKSFANIFDSDVMTHLFQEIEKMCDISVSNTKISLTDKDRKRVVENCKEQLNSIFLQKANDNLGILSLTKKVNNLLMWAHYANEHKGIVVEFNSNSELFDKALEVKYKNKRTSFDFNNPNIKGLFLTKSNHWKYEKEYRVLKKLNDPLIEDINREDNLYLFKFPKDAIKSIYCGCNMEQTQKDKILEIIKEDEELEHIKVYESKISNDYYKLIFNLIKD